MSAIGLAVRWAAPGSEAGCCVITVEDPDLLGHEGSYTGAGIILERLPGAGFDRALSRFLRECRIE